MFRRFIPVTASTSQCSPAALAFKRMYAQSSWRGMRTFTPTADTTAYYAQRTTAPFAARQPLVMARRGAVVVATKDKVVYMSVVGEILVLFLTYLLYTQQLGFDLVSLLQKVGIDLSGLGAKGISFGNGWELNIRMVLDYFFASMILSAVCMVAPIPGPMLVRFRK